MNLQEFKKELFKKNKKIEKEYYNNSDLAFEISELITRERIKQGLTQKQLAEKIGTKQSSIARAEGGSSLSSLKFLSDIARVLGKKLVAPKFESRNNIKDTIIEINFNRSSFGNINYIEKDKSLITESNVTKLIK